MPIVMMVSAAAAAATSAGALAIVSPSIRWPRIIETSGSAVVITASTGPIRVPAWKAFWFRMNPAGATTTSR